MSVDPGTPLTRENIDAILRFLPVLQAPGFVFAAPAENAIRTNPDGTTVFSMPFWIETEPAREFVTTLYDNGWILKIDWSEWGHSEGRRYVESPAALMSADLETIRKLLTAHVRQERFFEGHLQAMFESGHLVDVLRRIRQIREELYGATGNG